jgi:hypothetical protein
VTAALVDRLRAHDVDAAPPERREAIARDYAERPRLDDLPAFGGNWLLDDERNLWVQEFATVLDTAVAWSVFGEDGQWLGNVTMPTAFRPHVIGRDHVLGVWRDSLDVETVRGYPLIKP